MSETAQVLLGLAGSLVLLLLSGNIYFIKQLVGKIGKTAESAHEALTSITMVSSNVKIISDQLQDIKSEIKDLRRLEIEIAVIKSQMGSKQKVLDE